MTKDVFTCGGATDVAHTNKKKMVAAIHGGDVRILLKFEQGKSDE